jgi:hypothetical protein
MGNLRRAAAIAALLLATAGLPAAFAGGAANSKVTIKIGYEPTRGTSPYDPGPPHRFFSGQVKSGRASCESGRPVRVYRIQNRRRILFGSGRSDSEGFWRVPLAGRMKTAGYVAVVRARAGCLKGFSAEIAVGQRGPGGLGRR